MAAGAGLVLCGVAGSDHPLTKQTELIAAQIARLK